MALLVATGNAGKLHEIRRLLSDIGLEVLGLKDFPDAPVVMEDGDTFQANAIKKAREIAAFSGMNVLADDSGLVVEALDGKPGVFSARYAGPDADDAANNQKLLRELEGVPFAERKAAFYCEMALVTREGRLLQSSGRVDGLILDAPVGDGGFGYDPLFWLPKQRLSMAQIPVEEKNIISHRAQAFLRMLPYLQQL